MKFQDFLDSCESFDGEVIAYHLAESPYSFVWDDSYKVTEEGKKVFRVILNSEITFLKNGTIRLLDKAVTQEQYDLWMSATAGYISATLHDIWFCRPKKTIGTSNGVAVYVKTEVEDQYQRWHCDPYQTILGYYVLHEGRLHHVYKLEDSND